MALKAALVRCFASNRGCQIRHYSAPGDRSIPAAKQKYVPRTGTYPKGFLAGSAHAGVKPSNTKYDDVALVVSERPCAAAAVFTKNIFKAAPVTVSNGVLQRLRSDGIRGVIVNSGCANAVTGRQGLSSAERMAIETDQCFSSDGPDDSGATGSLPRTLVMSTGVIGQHLPMDRISRAIPEAHQNLGSTHQHWLNTAQAICTTDTFPKLLSRTFTLPSHPETQYSIAGMTKGAGMIHPNMATLLAIICTDVKIAPRSMRQLLRYGANRSFNCISIDGDTSTNDTVAFFANGSAAPRDVEAISVPRRDEFPADQYLEPGRLDEAASADAVAFREVLSAFMVDLAKLVVRDGEGATKFVTIRVLSDVSYSAAKKVATSIACSALVKTALYGRDANWGRILCAIGYTPGIIGTRGERMPEHSVSAPERPVVPERTSVSFVPTDGSAELKLLTRGEPEAVDEERAKEILEREDLEILVRLDDGPVPEAGKAVRNTGGSPGKARRQHEAMMWTCDFSHEYVTINGDYRT